MRKKIFVILACVILAAVLIAVITVSALARKPYSLNEILQNKAIFLGHPLTDLDHVNPSMGAFLHSYPNTEVNEIETSNAYLAYRTKDSDGKIVYLYCFFTGSGSVAKEHWTLRGPVLFAYERLSHADFADIAVGDPIEKVTQIDPATAQYYCTNPETDIVISSLVWESYHLLEDGILVITYDDALVVTDIAYYADFVIPDEVTGEQLTRKVDIGDLPK